MSLCTVLEDLAVDTWHRLRDSQSLEIRFGEETITDLLLLDLKRRNPPRTRIVQTPKSKEKDQGTDWEWWIGSPRVRWLRFAVQAKKLNFKSSRYDGLNHKIGSDLQIDLLEKYATRNRAIPLYCFYNHREFSATWAAWRCCKSFNEPQLACTITPSHIVRQAIERWGAKNFDWLHRHPQTLPWRCLAKCPKVHRLYGTVLSKAQKQQISDEIFGRAVSLHTRLPDEVAEGRYTGRLDHFSAEFYDPDVRLYPRRVVVLEFEPSEEAEFATD